MAPVSAGLFVTVRPTALAVIPSSFNVRSTVAALVSAPDVPSASPLSSFVVFGVLFFSYLQPPGLGVTLPSMLAFPSSLDAFFVFFICLAHLFSSWFYIDFACRFRLGGSLIVSYCF